VVAHVVRGHAVDRGRDLLAIAIIVEVGRRRAGDGDKPVFGVVCQRKVVKVRLLETY
jgi:hypothetical protein